MPINRIFPNAIQRLSSFLSSKIAKPREVVIEITDRCNLDCSFCFNKIYNRNRNEEAELNTENLKKIIDHIVLANIRQIRFSGGEPLIRENIFVLMEYAKSKGLNVWLNTNATLLDKEKIHILEKFVENVLIPLNAFNVTSEYKVTNRYLFKKKLKNIKLLRDTSIKVIRLGTVATKYNIQNLERIYDLVKRLNIDNWELFRPIPVAPNLLPVDNNDIAVLVEKLLKINKESNKTYKIYNALPFCCYDPEDVVRVANGAESDDGHTRFVIGSNGVAKPMYYLIEDIGNILKDNALTAWNNKFMKEMRRLHYVPKICKRCKYVKVCKGGSRIVSIVVGGDYRSLDYLAQPNKYRDILK